MMYTGEYDYKKAKMIFDPKKTENKTFSEIQKIYIKDHIKKLPKYDQKTIKNITKQIKNKIKDKVIVVTPVYIGEELDGLQHTIQEIKKQKKDFTSILYVNGYDPKRTKKNFEKKLSEIEKLIKGDKKFVVINNLYTKKQKIGTIISDMYDTVVHSLEHDAIIIRLDADTKEIPTRYFEEIQETFANNSISYTNTKIYYTKPNDHFIRIGELLSDLGGYRNSKDIIKVPSCGPGMSVKASDIIKIKGSQRDMERMEDYVIGWKITQYYGSLENPKYSKGKRYDKIIYCSPRRQIQNMLEGRYFHENTFEFEFVQEAKLDKDRLEYYNNIVNKLINNTYVSLQELKIIEEYINGFSINRTNISKVFEEYRNIHIAERSFYKAETTNNNLTIFTEKNFTDII